MRSSLALLASLSSAAALPQPTPVSSSSAPPRPTCSSNDNTPLFALKLGRDAGYYANTYLTPKVNSTGEANTFATHSSTIFYIYTYEESQTHGYYKWTGDHEYAQGYIGNESKYPVVFANHDLAEHKGGINPVPFLLCNVGSDSVPFVCTTPFGDPRYFQLDAFTGQLFTTPSNATQLGLLPVQPTIYQSCVGVF